ncbi:MAG TPA: ShlB/FhaC/HecB family hemolysin secretion/activation protein, partial [Segetibacter sp.]|nr:ShlB/FhaC/HecB family hemolysin secretion/activation protein [Segetibacter sp.]
FPYRIDSIRLYGTAKISRNFIHHYLNIERRSPYNKEKLSKINQRLLELPYLEQVQPWDVTMLNTGSLVNLYLAPKKSNQVNVLAGFLPSNQQLGGKLLLTVDANLQLQNAFGGGEHLGLIWQQIQPKSPRLNLQFTQPYMFNSSFGIDFLFELYKKDSSFLNINGQLGLLYLLSPDKTGKVFLQTQRTNVLQVDTLNIKASRRLPDIVDVGSVNLGIDYDIANTDYRFNPRHGNELTITALAGNKTIRKNTAITQIKDASFNYNSLYDSIKLKAYQFRLRAKAAQYFKTGKQTVLKAGINAGWYESPNYFRNELFQIGGYRLLRGFDEESIYANKYVVSTIEYRYLVGLNSNFFVFTDAGWTDNPIIKQSNTYLGAGIGLSFETKGGIFNVSYAVGKRNDVSFDIKQSKIHIGYVSIF